MLKERTSPIQTRTNPPYTYPFSVVIPAYNEEAGIAKTLDTLTNCEALAQAEIIVVNDGSTDRTGEIAKTFPLVKVLHHMINRGYGSAICTGTRAAHGEYVIWFDGDCQHRVEDLLKIADTLLSNQFEYCIGVRGDNSFEESNRKLGKWLIQQAVQFSAGRSIPDFNSGLRGFRRDVLMQYLHLLPKGFGASTLTTLLMIEGSHYGETVPIIVNRRIGKSTVKQFRDGFRTLQIILHIVLLFKPLQFFGLLGALFILAGGIYGFYKAMLIGLGFPVLGSLLIILGVQSFFFGLLCDQISALRRERFS